MRNRILLSCALVGVSVIALLTSVALRGDSSEPDREPITAIPATPEPTASPPATPRPDPTPRPRPDGVMPTRVIIPANNINATVEVGGIDENLWQMIAAEDPDVVAWYDYFPPPGQGGNAVFAGHVDYVGHGPAIFWTLRDTRPGDIVEIELSDGALLTYQVEFNEVFPADGGPWNEL